MTTVGRPMPPLTHLLSLLGLSTFCAQADPGTKTSLRGLLAPSPNRLIRFPTLEKALSATHKSYLGSVWLSP